MIENLLFSAVMLAQRLGPWRELRKATKIPETLQSKVLKEILCSNRETTYGRECKFDRITSYEEFAQNVPIVSYEDLRPYIEEQLYSGVQALTTEPPVMYARTSGTTGESKYVPLIEDELRRQRRHMALLTCLQYGFDRRAFEGKLLAMSAPAEEGRFENGVPYGSASGFLYAHMPQAVADKFVVPAEVFGIANNDLKYRAVLLLALAERNVTYLNAANPTTLTRLCALANEHGLELAADIKRGSFVGEADLQPATAMVVRSRLRADPVRARELSEIFGRPKPATFADLWPALRMVSTWTGGNCSVAAKNLRALLPDSASIVELGYLSSEFRGSLTIDTRIGSGLPTLQDYFFEFIEPEKWETGSRECHRMHELEAGRDYYVIITTPSGLYRYFINDLVRVTGRFGMTPTIRFVQKGKGVTNITGEKLYESHVVEAIEIASRKMGIQPVFFLMLADVSGQVYRLYLEIDGGEAMAELLSNYIDQALSELNEEYRAKRESDRLMRLQVLLMQAGTGEAYRAHCVRQGQKEGQFKMIALQYQHACDFPFESFVRGG